MADPHGQFRIVSILVSRSNCNTSAAFPDVRTILAFNYWRATKMVNLLGK
jgi:hypothetical protein